MSGLDDSAYGTCAVFQLPPQKTFSSSPDKRIQLLWLLIVTLGLSNGAEQIKACKTFCAAETCSFLEGLQRAQGVPSCLRSGTHHAESLGLVQQAVLHDVRIQRQAMEVLGSYHPFWLQQALEVVVKKRVPGFAGSIKRQKAALASFAAQHILNDADLAYEWATNKAIDGLYPPQYWVRQAVHSRFKGLMANINEADVGVIS